MKTMKRKSIKTYSDLKHEQSLLQMQLNIKENELSESWNYLKGNYKELIWKEVNPFKNASVLNSALNLIQPGLLPVIAEVAKGTIKGKPINLKVIGSTAKYAIASIGIKWLRKWIDSKDEVLIPEENISTEQIQEE